MQLHETGRAIVYPLLGLGGYATFIEVQSGRELRHILQLNALWNDEEHTIHVLEHDGPLTEVPLDPGKERFLVLVRPAKPIPPDADFEGTDRYMAQLHQERGAQVYRLVEDQVGYALVVNAESHDEVRMLLDAIPLSKKRQVRIQVAPIFTLQGERRALKNAGILSDKHLVAPKIEIPEVTESELRQMAAAGQPTIIDVREPDEWAVGHIPHASLIPLGQLPKQVDSLDPEAQYILVCRTGNRSSQAAAWLRGRGFREARSLRGGMIAWRGEVSEGA